MSQRLEAAEAIALALDEEGYWVSYSPLRWGILIRSREKGLLEKSDALEKLASLVKHGRYKDSIIEDARLKLEDKP